MTSETPKEWAGGGTGEPMAWHVYGLFPTPPSLTHFEFLKKSKHEAFKTF